MKNPQGFGANTAPLQPNNDNTTVIPREVVGQQTGSVMDQIPQQAPGLDFDSLYALQQAGQYDREAHRKAYSALRGRPADELLQYEDYVRQKREAADAAAGATQRIASTVMQETVRQEGPAAREMESAPVGPSSQAEGTSTQTETRAVPNREPYIGPEVFSRATKYVHDTLSRPGIDAMARKVRSSQEPRYGYWEPYAKILGKDDSKKTRLLRDKFEPSARAKAPEARNGFDLFVLGTSHEVPEDVRAPEGTNLTPFGYYSQTGERLAEALQNGQLPEGFEDPTTIEKTTALLLARGLQGLSNRPAGRNPDLDAAIVIMKEATKRVPGFNPANAGLQRLHERSIGHVGILEAESPHWNVSGNAAGRNIARDALRAAEETITILYVQRRIGLLDTNPDS